MLKIRDSVCSLLVLVGLFSLVWTEDEILSKPDLELVLLSETELKYLNERLQTKDHLNRDDAINAILELEHFYTLLKSSKTAPSSPSAMVDLAWHQHILHTQMYANFSREHFDIDFLHHLPYWSGNIEEAIKQEEKNPGKKGAEATYEALVELFGVDNINATVWLGDTGEHKAESSDSKENIEL